MLTSRHLNKTVIPIIAIVVISLTQFCPTASGFEMAVPKGGGFQTPNQKKVKGKIGTGQKDIKEIIANVNFKLEAVLAVANEGSEVAEQDIFVLDETLREASSFRAKFEKKELCHFYTLSAWTRYFAGDFKRALKDAMVATKTDPENEDAQATFITMSMLNKDYKRMAMSWEKIAETSLFTKENSSRSKSRRRSSSRNSSGMLDFSMELIMPELLGQTMSDGRLRCLNGSMVTYQFDGHNALCVLLWKAAPGTLIDDSGGKSKSRISASPGMMMPGTSSRRSSSKKTEDTTASRIKSYSDLFVSRFDDDGIRFIGVNLNDIYSKQGVMKQLLASPWPWAQIMADDPANELVADFLTLPIEEPTLIIVGPDSSICYAGAPVGFLPKVILASVFDMEQTDFSDTVSSDENNDTEPIPENIVPETAQVNTADQDQPAAQPIAKAETEEQEELNPRADSLLQMIIFHKKAGKFIGYKKMVDYSRDLFKEFPDSPQAKQARELLQKIPETYRKQFKVTDKEMGL